MGGGEQSFDGGGGVGLREWWCCNSGPSFTKLPLSLSLPLTFTMKKSAWLGSCTWRETERAFLLWHQGQEEMTHTVPAVMRTRNQ